MTGRVLVARVGVEWIAFGVGDVVAALDAPTVEPLPLTPSGVLGQLRLRGEWVPVLDPGRVLGIARTGTGPGAALVFRAAGGHFALWVDDVEEVREIAEGAERPVVGSGEQRGVLRALVRDGNRLLAWVDPTALRTVAEGILHSEVTR